MPRRPKKTKDSSIDHSRDAVANVNRSGRRQNRSRSWSIEGWNQRNATRRRRIELSNSPEIVARSRRIDEDSPNRSRSRHNSHNDQNLEHIEHPTVQNQDMNVAVFQEGDQMVEMSVPADANESFLQSETEESDDEVNFRQNIQNHPLDKVDSENLTRKMGSSYLKKLPGKTELRKLMLKWNKKWKNCMTWWLKEDCLSLWKSCRIWWAWIEIRKLPGTRGRKIVR